MTQTILSLKVRVPSWIGPVQEIADRHELKPDRLRVVIHQFFISWVKMIHMKGEEDLEPQNKKERYFPVNAALLKMIAGKFYNKYASSMESEDIVLNLKNAEGNSSYESGRISKQYKWRGLDGSMKTKQLFRFEIITDKCCIKSVLKTRDRYIRGEVRFEAELPEEIKSVINQLRDFTMEITILPIPETPIYTIKQELNLYYMQALADGELSWNKVDEFGERYHTPLTVVPKKYRKYLRFKGREDTPLIVLDFCNSQPYFSSIVGHSNLITELLPEFEPIAHIFKAAEEKEDFHLFRKLCCEGNIYEVFDPLEREIVKKRIFGSVIYANKEVKGPANVLFRRKFQKLFPTVVSIADQLKFLDENDLPGIAKIIRPSCKDYKHVESNDSHNIFPCMMQRLESRIMFRRIVPVMLKQGIRPFLTVHDSFILLPEHELQVRQIIADVFDSLGVPAPKVKRELL